MKIALNTGPAASVPKSESRAGSHAWALQNKELFKEGCSYKLSPYRLWCRNKQPAVLGDESSMGPSMELPEQSSPFQPGRDQETIWFPIIREIPLAEGT